MPDCFLSVAGVVIQLRTDRALTAGEAFTPFLTEPAEPDVCAEFVCVAELPAMPARQLSKNIGCRVFEKENGRTIRFFFESPDAPAPYGAAWEEADGTIRVEYLPEGARFVTDFSNSFAHLGIEGLLIRHKRLCFHAACVETDLGGILFSGPSGIGKSTQAELWCRYRNARQINGDRPALSSDEGGWIAWGSPYAGSSRVYVNDSCPVTAVVMLRQARSCSLRRLRAGEAFRAVWSGLAVHSWDRVFVERASGLAMDLAGEVPVYEFGCTPDETAVAFLEQELRKEIDL